MRGEFYDDVNLNDLLTCHLKGSPRTRRQRKKRNPPFYVYRLWNVVTGKEYVGQCEAEEGIEKRYKQHKNNRPKAMQEEVQDGNTFQNLFAMEVLHTVGTEAAADHNERVEIERRRTLVPNGYNIVKGAPRRQRWVYAMIKNKARRL